MTLPVAVFVSGAILLISALIGGGLKLGGQLEVPRLSRSTRITAAVLGTGFILLALWIEGIRPTDGTVPPTDTPVSTATPTSPPVPPTATFPPTPSVSATRALPAGAQPTLSSLATVPTTICQQFGADLTSGNPIPGRAEFVSPAQDCNVVGVDEYDQIQAEVNWRIADPVTATAWLIVRHSRLYHPHRFDEPGESSLIRFELLGAQKGDYYDLILVLADADGTQFLSDNPSFELDEIVGNITEVKRIGVAIR